MTIEAIIIRYGVLALFLGAGLEGETVVVLGGLLAHRGLVDPLAAAAAASAGSFCADQLFFVAGRRFRGARWMKRMMARPAFAKAMEQLERRPTLFILSFRFLYGLRTISPAAVGVSRIPAARFLMLNAIAAAIWGPLFTALGYAFGNGLERLFGRLRTVEHLFIAVLIGAVATWIIFAAIRRFRRA